MLLWGGELPMDVGCTDILWVWWWDVDVDVLLDQRSWGVKDTIYNITLTSSVLSKFFFITRSAHESPLLESAADDSVLEACCGLEAATVLKALLEACLLLE